MRRSSSKKGTGAFPSYRFDGLSSYLIFTSPASKRQNTMHLQREVSRSSRCEHFAGFPFSRDQSTTWSLAVSGAGGFRPSTLPAFAPSDLCPQAGCWWCQSKTKAVIGSETIAKFFAVPHTHKRCWQWRENLSDQDVFSEFFERSRPFRGSGRH